MTVLDLSHTISGEAMAYPGTEPPRLRVANTVEKDGFQETVLELYSHTGTHMDAPGHMLPGAPLLDELPASAFCGRAYVLDCTALGAGGRITAEMLMAAPLREADFFILSAGWEQYWGTPAYFGDFPLLTDGAVDCLLTLPLKGVGMDMMSIDPMDSVAFPNHHRLFEKGLPIIENLCNLAAIRGRLVDFAALPLKYIHADGAPVRAVAVI